MGIGSQEKVSCLLRTESYSCEIVGNCWGLTGRLRIGSQEEVSCLQRRVEQREVMHLALQVMPLRLCVSCEAERRCIWHCGGDASGHAGHTPSLLGLVPALALAPEAHVHHVPAPCACAFCLRLVPAPCPVPAPRACALYLRLVPLSRVPAPCACASYLRLSPVPLVRLVPVPCT